MKKKNNLIWVAAGAALLMASCGKSNNWSLEGQIAGASGKQLIVESQTFAGWQPTDTIELGDDGKFTVSHPAKGYPEIYRLKVDGRMIYFPVDSIESITLTADIADLDKSLAIEGSTDGDMIIRAERRIAEAVAAEGVAAAATDSMLKRDLAAIILERPQSVVAYYIINRRVNNVPLFNMSNPLDIKILGAVANAYKEYRPADPRTARLTTDFLAARANAGLGLGQTVEASAIGIHNIELYDVNGTKRTLADVAANNRVVVLNFTAYGAEFSPALNVELNRLYNQYRNNGVEIYQVAVDGDEMQWREAARNIPWIAVRNAGADANRNLMLYNVTALPSTFIIANGEIAERVDDISQLGAAINRH